MKLAAAAAFLVLAPAPALSVNMAISPLMVEIGSETPSAVVTVKNGGAAPARYQVTAHPWFDAAEANPRLEASGELSAFPPLFQLGPGEARKVRIGATAPPGATERAWRVVVEELPSAVDATAGRLAVRVRTRFAVAVFQAPARPQPGGVVSLGAEGGVVRAVVRNAGNVHLRPEARVAFLDGTGARLHEAEVPPSFVLPAAERVSDVPVPKEICAKVRSATLVADLRSRKHEAALALPGGACGP